MPVRPPVHPSPMPSRMWGRANMAAVTQLLLLGIWICIFAQGAEGSSEPKRPEATTILDRAISWLWSQRDKDAGWAEDTQRVLLALRLANLSRDDDIPPSVDLEMQLSTKQMELEIVMLLWRHREMGSSPVRLARYSLALNAMCMDPRQFHGHDLIGTLLHHEPPTDYEFALTALAACSAQAHVRKRQMRRLLDIAHAAQDHDVETVAMGIMTLRCIVQDHRHRNLQHFVRKPSVSLAHRQRRDGSFGELRGTALAMQALEEVENEPHGSWNRSGAIAWLAARQKPDGSYDGDVQITAEVVLGLSPRSLSSVRSLDCGQGLTDSPPPKFVTVNGDETPLSASPNRNSGTRTTSPLLPTTTSRTSSSPSSPGTEVSTEHQSVVASSASSTSSGQLVNVTYTLWVGSDVYEIHNLTLAAPRNESFYGVMVLAAERSTNFQFSAYEWPNGHYVHTLSGYKEEPMFYHYWLLYRLPSPPKPAFPPGNQFVAPGGVDDLHISDGEHYLFWYKKL
ncbi:PREDICTED: uncharacterized protein CG3556 [Ceratosolen solmsi marchali]|uniref:Uncharacterized protein CG3556 n=1 Tax=Ceratosolen solmsi marchali TaxID=326594 RepID=A0AAJ6VN24_9HYME|nr:PREDICTED: uncharacterized protein CG3556 [Ceratosolen solmsi marchali]